MASVVEELYSRPLKMDYAGNIVIIFEIGLIRAIIIDVIVVGQSFGGADMCIIIKIGRKIIRLFGAELITLTLY